MSVTIHMSGEAWPMAFYSMKLHLVKGQKFVQMVLITRARWPPCPYTCMVKVLKKTSYSELKCQ